MPSNFEVIEYDVFKDDYRNAANYDARRYASSADRYKMRVTSNAYKQLLGRLAGKRILDVGCGTGRGLTDFAGCASRVIGADASQDMLAIAKQKLGEKSGITLVRSFAQQLPFRDSSFDIVTALNFLHLFSLESQRAMISEMKRVLRPGGFVVLEFDNALHGIIIGPYKRYSGRERGSLPREIRAVVAGIGRITRIYGAVFPVVWKVFHRWPRIFIPVERLAYFWPLNWLAHRVFCRIETD